MQDFRSNSMRQAQRAKTGCSVTLTLLMLSFVGPSLLPAIEPDTDFEKSISGILVRRCLECHNSIDASGGLDLSRHDKFLAGGDSGAIVSPGKPEESVLIERIAAGEMPPEKNGKQQALPEEEISTLRVRANDGEAERSGLVVVAAVDSSASSRRRTRGEQPHRSLHSRETESKQTVVGPTG